MASTDVDTPWYENLQEGTFHEVVSGSDHEKQVRRQTYQPDPEDPDYVEPVYKKISPSRLPDATKQPGYVVPDAPAAPMVVQMKSAQELEDDEVERRVAARLEAEREAWAAAQIDSTPQTPTADTKDGPLVGKPGAQAQADREVELGGAAPSGVKPSATAESASKRK